jgi:hypothetical protein
MAFKDAADRDLYEKTFRSLVEKNAPLDEQVNALSTLSPEKALDMRVRQKIAGDKSESAAAIQQLRGEQQLSNALLRAELKGGSGSSSSGRGSADAGGEHKMKDSDLIKVFDMAIPDDGFQIVQADGKAGALPKSTVYAQSNARLPDLRKSNPGVNENSLVNVSVEATKYHNGIQPNGVVNFKDDGKGGFLPVMTVREATGSRDYVIGQSIPYNQIGSLDGEKLKKLNTQLPSKDQIDRAELSYVQSSYNEAKDFKAKFESLTPQQVANLSPEIRKKGQNIDQDISRFAATLSAYAEPAGREARGIKVPASFTPTPKPVASETTTRAGKVVSDAWGSVRDWAESNRFKGSPAVQKDTRAGFDYYFKDQVPK